MLEYFVGESTKDIEIDATVDANVFASNIKKGGHTGSYNDLDNKLKITPSPFKRKKQPSPYTPKNPTTGTITWSVAESGYTPICIMGYDVSNKEKGDGSGGMSTYGF